MPSPPSRNPNFTRSWLLPAAAAAVATVVVVARDAATACLRARCSTAAPLRATSAARLSISLRSRVSVGGGTSGGGGKGRPAACGGMGWKACWALVCRGLKGFEHGDRGFKIGKGRRAGSELGSRNLEQGSLGAGLECAYSS
eukprot:1160582-Pelagomonas_calceolata.AAC.15